MVLLRICVILILDLIIGLYSRFFPLLSPTADKPRVRLIKSSQDLERYNVTFLFHTKSVFHIFRLIFCLYYFVGVSFSFHFV